MLKFSEKGNCEDVCMTMVRWEWMELSFYRAGVTVRMFRFLRATYLASVMRSWKLSYCNIMILSHDLKFS
uniref:Uncharacterized protein n=1 Tax=Panagrolaimus sp. JU765 TaxID=591449 RepID=A0AC34QBA2_9BILA